MKANRAYRLNHARGGPRLFAAPDAVDTVEIVDIASNEVVLFWDVPTRDARHFVNTMRAELSGADAEDFVARWSAVGGPEDL
ncbi:MAG TPA: hypothetical protein VFZ89_04330 [Solirubrobacteraceae bacterium]